MKDEGIDRAIRNTLAERSVRESGSCPDDSRIAAYLDSRLRPEENAEFEAHAARCEACREILALSMRLGEETCAAQPAIPPRGARVLFHFAMPASALALLVIALGAGIFYFRAMRNTSKAPAETRTADLRIPAKPPEPPQLSRAPESEVPGPSATPQQKSGRGKGSPEPHTGYFAREAPLPAPEGSKDEVSGRDRVDAPAALQDEGTEMKAESVAVTGGAASPPPATASNTRSLHANAPEPPVGAAAGLRLQKSAASAERAAAQSGQYRSSKPAADSVGSQDIKKIGGRTFVRTEDTWVDDECKKHPEASVIVIRPDSEEYSEILKSYPELRDLRPFMIFWKGRPLSFR